MPPLTRTPMPLLRGEDTGTGIYGDRPGRVENGLLTGQDAVEQVPDWRLGDTCKDLAGTPIENDAVVGGGPFATQGGASAPSGGVCLSFDTSGNALFLHQLAENQPPTILRTLAAYTSYVESAPPQMTGFEFFGRYLMCIDGREAAASRKGLAIFDPTGAGTFTVASVSVVAGGAATAALRFRGIAKHRGATVIGWGYQSEEAGEIDVPDFLRGSGYGTTDMDADASWQADDLDTGPWGIKVGTPGLPIVGCAASGEYTIVGKASEIFALGGDYKAQLFYTRIGEAHGPVSVTGIVSTGPMAVWMSQRGPAVSVGGGRVQLLGLDRIRRRMLTYYDLTYTCSAHDSQRTRVGFGLRRLRDLDGNPLTASWADQIWWWDYERDELTTQGTPATIFCLFTTNGPGTSLAAPSGTPSSLVATATMTTCGLTWSHATGDPTAQTVVEYKRAADSTYIVAGTSAVGAVAWTLTGLTAATLYDWRLKYVKNGQVSAYVAGSQFTTLAADAVGAPTNLAVLITSSYEYGSKTYAVASISWTQATTAPGAMTDLFEGTTSTFSAATVIASRPVALTSTSRTQIANGQTLYYWVRDRLADGTVGAAVGPVSVVYTEV